MIALLGMMCFIGVYTLYKANHVIETTLGVVSLLTAAFILEGIICH